MSAYNKTKCIHKQKGNISYVGGSESKWAVNLLLYRMYTFKTQMLEECFGK